MEVIRNNFFLGLVGDASSLISKSSRRSLAKHQAAITVLLDMIDLVRQHRSLTHQFLFSRETYSAQELSEKISLLDGEITTLAMRLTANRYIGNSIERIALRNKLVQLTSNYTQRSVSNNLVVHGKMIRQLIFQVDGQILISLDKANKLDIVGDYNEQWQTVMSGIEALTQYRLAIMAMNMGMKPALIAKQACLLHTKLIKIAKSYADFHPDLNDAIDTLGRYLIERESCLEYQDKLFTLSSDISSALIDVYEAIIEKTYAKAINNGYAA